MYPAACYRVRTVERENKMALAETGTAPYAPVRSVLTVIEQYRDKGIPTPITTSTLVRIGVEESLATRTLGALKILDLVGDDGEPTDTMKKIKTAPTAELHSVLTDWVRGAYKPIFTYVEPTDDVQRIADQFRHYEPAGQRNRMVTLFLGLCARAGLIADLPPIPRPNAKGTSTVKPTIKGSPPARTRTPIPDKHDPVKLSPALPEARQRYIDMLIERAQNAEQLDPDLLDRIERALGLQPDRGAVP